MKRKFPDNQGIQKAKTINSALQACGWMATFNAQTKDLTGLKKYNAQYLDSQSHIAMIIIAPFVEPGGYIQMADEISGHYWVYFFNGKTLARKSLTKLFVDFTLEDDVLHLFKKTAAVLVSKGFDRQQLFEIIGESLVSEILD